MTKKTNQNSETTAECRLDAVKQAMAKIEKTYGKGAIMMMGENTHEKVEVIPTGSVGLDHALGVGGYPRGRIVEIYGTESSGKTTLAITAIAEAQKQGGIAAFIDAEHSFDRFYAEKLGVDTTHLLIAQPDNGEQALEIAEQLIRSAAIDIIVIDSVAALTTKAEIEGDMGDNKVGLQARLMSQALRKLSGVISQTHTCCIFINQLRQKIGVMFGPSEVTTGGLALKYYASVRLDVRRLPGDGQPRECQGGEEQGGSPVPQDGVRPDLRRGHRPDGRGARPGSRGRHHQEERLVLSLRGQPAGAGTFGDHPAAARHAGAGCGDRGEGARQWRLHPCCRGGGAALRGGGRHGFRVILVTNIFCHEFEN